MNRFRDALLSRMTFRKRVVCRPVGRIHVVRWAYGSTIDDEVNRELLETRERMFSRLCMASWRYNGCELKNER